MVQQAGGAAEQGSSHAAAAVNGSQPQTDNLPTNAHDQPSDGADVEVFSRAEMEEYANEKHSKLRKQLSETSRWVGLGHMTAEELEATRARVTELEEQLRSMEEQQAKSDPDVFDVVQARRELADKEKRLADQKRRYDLTALEHYEAIEAGKRWKHLEQTKQIADEFQLSVDELLSHNFETFEEMRAFAQGKATAVPPRPMPKPDSGMGAAGIDWHNLSPEEKIRMALERRK